MDINETVSRWVRAARTHAKLSGEQLGARLAIELGTPRGHSKGNISHWELAKHRPNLQQLIAISRITGFSLPNEILASQPANSDANTGHDRRVSPIGRRASDVDRRVFSVDDDDDNPAVARIRKVKLRLSAGIVGFATEPEHEDENPIYFRRDWLAQRGYRPENLIAIRVKGESMEPKLYDGDTVVINTADAIPKDGEVFAVNYEGEDVVKRLIRDAGKWWLSSDNPDDRRFPKKECAGDMCLIVGRVVHKQSERI